LIKFVETDAEKIANEMIKTYENATGQILYTGDPRRIFLLQFVPILVALKNDINITANQELLPYASGEVLDALGQLVGVTRIAAQPAKTTMRFTLSTVQINDLHIPKGTRVTPDGVAYFSTIDDLVIKAGDTFGDVLAESNEGGEKYNGFVPGQISILVDPIAYVSSVANIDTSYGGSDQESDDALRERIRLAPSTYSTAGPEAGYIYHAKSADVNILDVAVTSTEPCEVNIYVLMKNGELPDATVIDKVTSAVNQKHVRPLTDLVTVLAPDVVNYDIDLTYYIWKERATEETIIRNAIESSGGAVDQYIEWQHSKLGRAITPDSLLSRLYAAGAARVEITSPVYTELEPYEVAKLGTKTVTYGGLI
jgi:phage-related baseplate assembly protein